MTNDDDVPVAATVSTAYGSKTFSSLAAAKSVAQAWSTRLVEAPAGVAQVAVTANVGGQPVSATVEAEYSALNCG